jgi:hypothetical protein
MNFDSLIHAYIEFIHNVKLLVWRCKFKSRTSSIATLTMCKSDGLPLGLRTRTPTSRRAAMYETKHWKPAHRSLPGGRLTARQLQNQLPLTFKNYDIAAQSMDALTARNSSWVRATPLSAGATKYAPIA